MKMKITLDTQTAAMKLVQIAHQVEEDVYLVDGSGRLCVHARSLMGVLYSMEFKDLWLECDGEHYYEFNQFAEE
jgi:hypothetical protein